MENDPLLEDDLEELDDDEEGSLLDPEGRRGSDGDEEWDEDDLDDLPEAEGGD